MPENNIIIPCEVLKRITPLLEDCIYYEHIMFLREFEKMEALFDIGKVTDDPEKLKQGFPEYLTEDEMNFFLRKRSHTPLRYVSFSELFDIILDVGNNLILPVMSSPKFPPLSIEEFDKIWDDYKLPHDDYYYAFLILIAVFAKYTVTYGAFDAGVESPFGVRYEKLKLLQLLMKTKPDDDKNIKISCDGKSISLCNCQGWLLKTVYASLGEEMNLEAIEKELKEKYTPNSQTGRKKKTGQCNLLLGAYNLIQRTTLHTKEVILNDVEALFLIKFFEYMHMDEQKKEMNSLYMRALLAHYQIEQSTIKWWYFE